MVVSQGRVLPHKWDIKFCTLWAKRKVFKSIIPLIPLPLSFWEPNKKDFTSVKSWEVICYWGQNHGDAIQLSMVDFTGPQSLCSSSHQEVESISSSFHSGLGLRFALTNRMLQNWHEFWRLQLKRPYSFCSCHVGMLPWGCHVRKLVYRPGGWEAVWRRTQVPGPRASPKCLSYEWSHLRFPNPADLQGECSCVSDSRRNQQRNCLTNPVSWKIFHCHLKSLSLGMVC